MMRQIRPWRSRMHMHGLGLIELMIAVTIGLVLIAGALSVFVNSRQTYRTNQEFARLMESGNYALDQISQSVRLAGYWGKYNTGDQVRRRTGDPSFAQLYLSSPATTDCTAGWYADTERGVEALTIPTQAIKTPAFRITVIKLTPTYWWFGMSTQPR